MVEAAPKGDIFCTVTGDAHVIGKVHFEVMKDGAMVANAGHFNVEIDLKALGQMAVSKEKTGASIETFTLADGRKIHPPDALPATIRLITMPWVFPKATTSSGLNCPAL